MKLGSMRTSEMAPFCNTLSCVRFFAWTNSNEGSFTKWSPTPSSIARFDCVAKPTKPGGIRTIETGPFEMTLRLTLTVDRHSKPGE